MKLTVKSRKGKEFCFENGKFIPLEQYKPHITIPQKIKEISDQVKERILENIEVRKKIDLLNNETQKSLLQPDQLQKELDKLQEECDDYYKKLCETINKMKNLMERQKIRVKLNLSKIKKSNDYFIYLDNILFAISRGTKVSLTKKSTDSMIFYEFNETEEWTEENKRLELLFSK